VSQPRITKHSAAADGAVINDSLDRDGAVIITGLLSPAALRQLHDELDHKFDEAAFCIGEFYGSTTKRLHSLIAKSAVCRDMILMPSVLGAVNHVLGRHCDKIQVNLTQGIQIWPGERAQVPHRDDSMFPIATKPCEFMVNAMWAYSPFTRDNGATMVVPGSHRWDPQRVPRAEHITHAEMDPGDVLIYLGSLIHAGGANTSTEPRTGIALSYCLGWIRQSENQYFAVPPHIARTFAKELQDLLGYCVQRPNLGMVEGNEPNVLFHEPDLTNLVTRDWLTPDQNEQLRRYHAGDHLVAV
jgi:hypothetical protein